MPEDVSALKAMLLAERQARLAAERLADAGIEPSVGSVGDCGACPRA